MNKSELINEVVAKTELKKKDMELAVNSMLDIIETALANKEKVKITGFCTLESVKRAPRVAINLQTKQKINVPAQNGVKFTASKALKKSINE